MNSKQVMFFSVGMMVMILAGCGSSPKVHPSGSDVKLPSERTLSISESDKKSGQSVTVKLDEVSPGKFTDTNNEVTVTETMGDSFQIEIPGMKINISAPPIPPRIPVFIQPLTHVLWEDAQAGRWDIKNMQLYISGTVALENEDQSTRLQLREKSKTVEEILKGTNLTGQAKTGEMITHSAYANTFHVVDTMTPGMVISGSTENGKNKLQVSFEPDANGEKRVLSFVQDTADSGYGYFYLEPKNKDTIKFGDKDYEVRYDFDGRSKKPYLLIRTELSASLSRDSLPGRRVQ
jgi:hypothetical protein